MFIDIRDLQAKRCLKLAQKKTFSSLHHIKSWSSMGSIYYSVALLLRFKFIDRYSWNFAMKFLLFGSKTHYSKNVVLAMY